MTRRPYVAEQAARKRTIAIRDATVKPDLIHLDGGQKDGEGRDDGETNDDKPSQSH